MKHILTLEIPDTNNTTIFRVVDTSIYAEEVPVKCPTLEITAPGFVVPVQIEATPDFNLKLTACMLGLSVTGCNDNPAHLSDGIYNVRYSVSPNELVYVEYNHLRITDTLNEYMQHLCNLEISACEPAPEIKSKLKELRLIRSLLDTAKIKVEFCNTPHQGMEIFNYAKKKLKNYSGCKNC